MHIYVDADACPVPIKEILFRAANRKEVHLTLVANQWMRVPPSAYIKSIQVPAGFDVADNEIVQRVQAGDLVITGDVPLAAEVIEKGAQVIHIRGELLTTANISERLQMRNLTTTLRDSGLIEGGGPKAFNQADKAKFANTLDRVLQELV